MKELSGRELAGYVKERQAGEVRSLKGRRVVPRLVIIRDNDNPVISKYVGLKKRYGEDIGVVVEDRVVGSKEILTEIRRANEDETVSGIIVQLPLEQTENIDEVLGEISAEKDVDGLSKRGAFDSATATAICWLLAGYGVDLKDKKVALVGRGRLVGEPLERMLKNSGVEVEAFRKSDGKDMASSLPLFDVIISATGVPRLIKSEMIKEGAAVVDAGTASENGVLVGDVDDVVRERDDVLVTPKIGGVGPLTVSVLFDNVIRAAKKP